MKLNKIAIASVLVLGATFSSCSDILDKKPLTEISGDAIWTDPSLVKSFVNSRYNQVGHGWTEAMLSSCCDETSSPWDRGCNTVNFATISPTDLGRLNGGWYGWDNRSWTTKWTNISNCNIFFENVDKVSFANATEKEQLKGQVRFLRVFEFNDLVKRWGGLPIITRSFTINDVGIIRDYKRNTYKECVDFMVSQLDSAANELPATWSGDDYGRATSVAAKALKAKILLYAASPLMNDNVKMPEIGYTNPDPDRWKKAADAATDALDAALAAGYKLYQKDADPSKNYQEIFLDNTSANTEVLFARMGTSSAEGDNLSAIEQYYGPNGYGGWGGSSPLEDFVEDYEVVKDGVAKKFDWKDFPEGTNPYENRDPRFYATVLYDGAKWASRNLETYFDVDANGTIQGGGKDTRYGNDAWNSSPTGYNLKKFLFEDYQYNSWNFKAHNWIWLRLADVYLMKAEALYHTGDEDGAREALNAVRHRAGMPDVTATGEALLDAIKHERRIELAFEEDRFYDVRRWKDAPQTLGRTVHAITIKKYPDGHKTYAKDALRTSEGGDRKWDDKMYWLPIMKSEIDKNSNLVQNPGY
jgi:hypothetical protein